MNKPVDPAKAARTLARARRKEALRRQRRIIHEELPHVRVFTWILVVGIVLAVPTLGIGLLLAVSVGAFYMAFKTAQPAKRLPEYERAAERMAHLAVAVPEHPRIAKYAVSLAATRDKVAAKAGAR